MALTPRLEMRQSQSLTLTPQLVQSIKMLQLSHLELNQFVDEELLLNPLLERAESDEVSTPATQETGDENQDQKFSEYPDERVLDTFENSDQPRSAAQIADSMDTDVANLFPEQVGQDSIRQSTAVYELRLQPGGGETANLEQYVPSLLTLRDHLDAQVNLLIRDPKERLIARYLIDSLNETGYLASTCAAIALQLGTEEKAVEEVLLCIQTCDPTGVFARDVKECLALQLREKDRFDPLMARLLDNLDLVVAHDLPALRRVVGASKDDLDDMLLELRELNPRPGRAFDQTPIQPIVADVFVSAREDGAWSVELNSDILPRVLVNRTYFASVTGKARSKSEKNFLVDCLQKANWLTKSLDQRARTILKTATEIVRMQDDFLVHGVTRLKPMTLKMVAEAIDMHESTISRVTSNKYISTPRGLFEMKYFFTTALAATSGEGDFSSEGVRFLIKQMIDKEDLKSILSDETIATRLRDTAGIDVARRTVAKYREALRLPSSVIRRRQKKAQRAGS